jgi:hypothetical protein
MVGAPCQRGGASETGKGFEPTTPHSKTCIADCAAGEPEGPSERAGRDPLPLSSLPRPTPSCSGHWTPGANVHVAVAALPACEALPAVAASDLAASVTAAADCLPGAAGTDAARAARVYRLRQEDFRGVIAGGSFYTRLVCYGRARRQQQTLLQL